MYQYKNQSGFTLVELVIVLIVIVILLSVSLPSLSSYRKRQSLQKDTDLVVEVIREARNLTIVSKNANNYGVHFDMGSTTLFVGSSYSASNTTNKVYYLSNGLTIETDIPAGTNLIFNRVTGESNLSSTAHVKIIADETASTSISVYKTGAVELQK